MDIKQLRLRLIEGINFNGNIIYSAGYDLMDKSDIDLLQLLTNKITYLYGFVLEKSYFEINTYNKDCGKNEFEPVIGVVCDESWTDDFTIANDKNSNNSCYVIRDSILEVRNDLNELLINSRYGVDDTLGYAYGILTNNISNKKVKKYIK